VSLLQLLGCVALSRFRDFAGLGPDSDCRCIVLLGVLLLSRAQVVLKGSKSSMQGLTCLPQPHSVSISACVDPSMHGHAIDPCSLPSTCCGGDHNRVPVGWWGLLAPPAPKGTAHMQPFQMLQLVLGKHWGCCLPRVWVVVGAAWARLGLPKSYGASCCGNPHHPRPVLSVHQLQHQVWYGCGEAGRQQAAIWRLYHAA
jgi:hypothetical protein